VRSCQEIVGEAHARAQSHKSKGAFVIHRSSFIVQKIPCPFLCAVLLGVLSPASTRGQARIEGQILNGTTSQPVAKQEVRLLSPRQGMQQVATASTDANGRFAFGESSIDSSGAFYLLETAFQGVRYHEPVRFDSTGRAAVNIAVYDLTSDRPALRVQALRVLVQVAGPKARVRTEYEVKNASQPPRAYADPKGTFHFRLPPGVGQPTVAVMGLLNMPLPQTAEAGGSPGEFFLRYPLKPGVTTVTADYEADYSAAKLALSEQVPYAIDHAEMYIFPSSIAVDSAVFKLAGVDSKNRIEKLEAENLPGDTTVEARLSGEAAGSPPSESGEAEGGPAEGGQEVKITSASMTRLALPILACFLLVFLWALGVRLAKEWPRVKAGQAGPVRGQPSQKRLGGKAEKLLNSLADLDELFAAGKIAEKDYWKERLELKARLVANLKKSPSASLESYAGRSAPL